MGKLSDMASGAAEAAQGAMDKAAGAAQEAMDKAAVAAVSAADKAMGSVVPGKKQLDEMSDTMSNLGGPVTDLKGKLTGGMPDDAQSATKAFKEASDLLGKSVAGMLDGDGKDLIPGSAACVASCWISSVKSKLKAFKVDVDGLAGKATAVPGKVMEELNLVIKQADAFADSLATAAACPKGAIGRITGALTDPEKLSKIPEEIEKEFNDLLAAVRKQLSELTRLVTGASSNVLLIVKAVIDEVDVFLPRVPNKLSSAFKPPAIACCCGGAGKALDVLTESADSMISCGKLDPVLKAAEAMKSELDKLDTTPISTTLDEMEGKFKEATQAVKDASDKLNNSSVGTVLRKLAGSEEGHPYAPDAPGTVPEESS